MADIDFEKFFGGGEDQEDDQDSIAEGTYDVKVLDTRSKNRMVYLDLEVLSGPLAGGFTSVGINIPASTAQRGARHYFRKKTAGFKVGPEVGAAMNGGDPAPILAEVLKGQSATVELSKEKEGNYAGRNQLESSKPLDGAPAAAAPAAAPVKAEAAEDIVSVDAPVSEDLAF